MSYDGWNNWCKASDLLPLPLNPQSIPFHAWVQPGGEGDPRAQGKRLCVSVIHRVVPASVNLLLREGALG